MLRGAVLLAVVLLVPAAGAFDSLPGGPHDQITEAAAVLAGYPSGGIAALKEAVRGPDIRDNKLDPKATKVTNFEVTADYQPYHHCDRVPPVADGPAFAATVGYVSKEGDAAIEASRAGNANGAVNEFGKALHAIEDCFSHSNAIDLPDPQAVARAINNQASPPSGLRLTGFLPGAQDNEYPPGDTYSHGDFAKDSASKNNESKTRMSDNRTKYDAARDLATVAAAMFLRERLAHLNQTELDALSHVTVAKQSAGFPKIHVPSLPVLPVAAALLLLAALRRPRRPNPRGDSIEGV